MYFFKKQRPSFSASRYVKQEVKLIYIKNEIFHIKYWLVLLWIGCRLVLSLWTAYTCAGPLCYNAAMVSWQRDRKWGLGAVCTSPITCIKTLILDALVCMSHTLQTSGNYSCGSLPNQPPIWWQNAGFHRIVKIGDVVYRSLSPLRGSVLFVSGSNSIHSSPRRSKTFFL